MGIVASRLTRRTLLEGAGILALGSTGPAQDVPRRKTPPKLFSLREPDLHLVARIRAMPKTEIHVHLEGSMEAETAWQLAERNKVILPVGSLDEWRQFYACRDFKHFIQVYLAANKAIKKPEDYATIIERLAEKQAGQNVAYSEVFVSASVALKKMSADDLLSSLKAGLTAARARYNVEMKFIPDIARGEPASQDAVLQLAAKGAQQGLVVGLGLGGTESGARAEVFSSTYELARKRGLRVVAHAGETEGPASIRAALSVLKAERIGHGIRCLDDEELTRILRDDRIPLEVCPTSNYRLGLVSPDQPHPIRRMFDAGLVCTVNSDDPPMFGTTLSEEYVLLARQGFSWSELRKISLDTIDATFLGASEKRSLRRRWEDFAQANSTA